jgi:DNA-binding transcriptional MerR regulator
MTKNCDHKYNIGVISIGCGIKTPTLRVWEKRYKAFTPNRSDSGLRLYSDTDLERAKLLGFLTRRGMSISEIANLGLVELEKLREDIEPMALKHAGDTLITNKLFSFLEQYDADSISQEIRHLRMKMGVREFIFDVVLPLIRQVGYFVQQEKYTVTQEHIISTLLREQLSQYELSHKNVGSTQVTLATPDGNIHELSILIANLLCRSNRVSTKYLGAAHPADSLACAINYIKSPILVLGTISSESWQYEKEITPYLKNLDDLIEIEITVYIGGGQALKMPVFKNIKTVKFLESFEELELELEQL